MSRRRAVRATATEIRRFLGDLPPKTRQKTLKKQEKTGFLHLKNAANCFFINQLQNSMVPAEHLFCLLTAYAHRGSGGVGSQMLRDFAPLTPWQRAALHCISTAFAFHNRKFPNWPNARIGAAAVCGLKGFRIYAPHPWHTLANCRHSGKNFFNFAKLCVTGRKRSHPFSGRFLPPYPPKQVYL